MKTIKKMKFITIVKIEIKVIDLIFMKLEHFFFSFHQCFLCCGPPLVLAPPWEKVWAQLN